LLTNTYEHGKKICAYQPFSNLPDKYFAAIRGPNTPREFFFWIVVASGLIFFIAEDESQRENMLRLLLQALDECASNKQTFARAAKSGLEAAIRMR
jgi:hypothetical protein